jgi:serine/threonine protein kinase
MALLNKNEKLIATMTKSSCQIIEEIGSGGQGEVYKAKWKGKEYAVKWYYRHTATKEQKKILETLIHEGSPNENFLWPVDIAANQKSFGYIMGLRPKEYKVMVCLMSRHVEPTFHSLITSGIKLADSFFKLHAKGLCYRDISYNNIFLEPNSGDILICDNDNVTYNNIKCSTVLGTPKFMAPEVVVRKSLPNQYTDLYSLAILLFYLLFISHPLEGELEYNIKCLDVPAMTKLYGENPVFIFDPDNQTNRPVRGIHDNAYAFKEIYPDYIMDAFTKSFTEGIKDPENGRVRETIWRNLLLRLRDSILYCKCGAENFYDLKQFKAAGELKPCWSCGLKITVPPRINIDNNIIMLNYDTKIYNCHLDKLSSFDLSGMCAEVQQHPKNPGVWGIKNLMPGDIHAEMPDGTIQTIPAGKSITLADGLTIDFGTAKGIVKV